jgi:RNase P subunit RPR2
MTKSKIPVPSWIKADHSCLWCGKLSPVSKVDVKFKTGEIYVTYTCSSLTCDHRVRYNKKTEQVIIYAGERIHFYQQFLRNERDERKKEVTSR